MKSFQNLANPRSSSDTVSNSLLVIEFSGKHYVSDFQKLLPNKTFNILNMTQPLDLAVKEC